MICEPLELMTLRAVLEANGHQVEIVDMIVEHLPIEHFIRALRPHLVGITGYISHVEIIKDYARRVKAADTTIQTAVGGVHAEVCPGDFGCSEIDYVFGSAHAFYEHVGCTVFDNLNPSRILPEKYRKKYYYLFHKNCALIKTAVGCPYNCNFCFCKLISEYKARDMDSVICELAAIPQPEIYIVDDDFLYNRERLLLFAQKLAEHGIRKRFLVYGRADFIAQNEDVIQILAEAGLRAVIVGLEAASQETLDAYNKNTRVSDNEKAVAVLKKYNVECYATVILGMEFARDDFRKLYSFLHKLGIVFVNLQPLTPMPGTQYFTGNADKFIVPYCEKEKWDMAHLVVMPEKLTVRQYYFEILKLYYMLTMNPRSSVYMIKKYGLMQTLKLSVGAMKVTAQYINKMLKG